jgi:hypothetical protein
MLEIPQFCLLLFDSLYVWHFNRTLDNQLDLGQLWRNMRSIQRFFNALNLCHIYGIFAHNEQAIASFELFHLVEPW